MSDINPGPSALPPQVPPALEYGELPPLGHDPAERVPITNIVATVDAVLRQPRRIMFQLYQPGSGKLAVMLLLVAIGCSVTYGVVVGTFSGGAQLWMAPVKITVGFMISALICLPSLYIFTCLSGSKARLADVCGLLAGLLLLMTLLLIGFAPVAWIFSQSTESLAFMGALHLLFWFIATIFGLRFLETGFMHSQARSRAGFRTWAFIFVLVAMQMTTALRPIIGKADTLLPTEKKFFLAHWGDCLFGPNDEWKAQPKYQKPD